MAGSRTWSNRPLFNTSGGQCPQGTGGGVRPLANERKTSAAKQGEESVRALLISPAAVRIKCVHTHRICINFKFLRLKVFRKLMIIRLIFGHILSEQ